jgi:hypothetical protein
MTVNDDMRRMWKRSWSILGYKSSLNAREKMSYPYKTTGKIIKMNVFLDIEPCCLVEVYQCFRGADCHHQGRDYKTQHPRRHLHTRRCENLEPQPGNVLVPYKLLKPLHFQITATEIKHSELNGSNHSTNLICS